MSRKSKSKLREEAYQRLFEDLVKNKDLNRFKDKSLIYKRIYGDMDGLLFYTTREFIFHQIIIPSWLSSTNIHHRNDLYNLVKETLGKGLADELQRISNKRTW